MGKKKMFEYVAIFIFAMAVIAQIYQRHNVKVYTGFYGWDYKDAFKHPNMVNLALCLFLQVPNNMDGMSGAYIVILTFALMYTWEHMSVHMGTIGYKVNMDLKERLDELERLVKTF